MTKPSPAEFIRLPYYPWLSRPESLELDPDECATALFLDHGRIDKAAQQLKVEPRRLRKAIRRYARLRLLLTRLEASPDDAVATQDGKVGGGR